MGYQIQYDTIGKLPRNQRRRRTGWFAGFCVIALLAGAITVKAVGLNWVQEFLLPGDPAVTAAALEDLVEDLREGDSLGEAITAFCEEIMEHAEAAD